MKKKISCFMVITLLAVTFNINTVKADTVTQTVVRFNNGVLTGYEKLLEYAGMLIDTGIAVDRATLSFVKDRLVALGLILDSATEADIQQFFDDNIVQSPHSNSHHNIEYKEPLNIYIRSEMNAIQQDTGYTMCYSYSLINNINNGLFSDGQQYNALRRLVSSKDQTSWIMYNFRTKQCFVVPFSDDIGFVRTQNFTAYEYATTYLYSTWTYGAVELQTFDYDSSAHEYVSGNNIMQNATGSAVSKTENNIFGQYGAWVSNYKSQQILVYNTLNDLKRYSVGAKPYYLTDRYNNYNSVTGSYNTTTDNSVTYGDVYNYVNNYYDDKGEYPTQAQINIYIQNPSSGGGSGGGSGGSGGSGGDSDDLGIFDFLSRIGAVLGNLIKNLGNVLAELVEGLAETVNSLFESIPTVFNSFMQGVFSWLPTELLSIITLGIAAMILVGIIKIFKG